MRDNILVTGSKGFIGRNLLVNLRARDIQNIYEVDVDTDSSLLEQYCSKCSFIFHLAGVNRPENNDEFMEGNYSFTEKLLSILSKCNNTSPIMLASSIQATLSNPYGVSKKAAEDILRKYHQETGAQIYIYRFPNLFGKWSKPNYNSVVATFCNNIANSINIKVDNPNSEIQLAYIDDVVNELISLLECNQATQKKEYYEIPLVYNTTVGYLASTILSFPLTRKMNEIPYVEDGSLEKKLYSTYLSYLPTDGFSYPLEMHVDQRGSFTELFRLQERGQVSVNISKPGIEKGNHWHNTKCEKFCVISGKAIIQFRKPDCVDITTYNVSGENMEVVDIPCGYTHNIINVGDSELVTIMWCNEYYDPEFPDTYYCKVNK